MRSDTNVTCFWWQERPPTPAPPAIWQDNAEIIIVGCGFTGLSAALTLARAGKQVVVLEKGLIGEGASTRNGGITSGNIRLSATQLKKRFGAERAQQFFDEAVAARADLARFISDEKIECDFQPVGRVVGLTGQFSVDGIKRDNAAFQARYDIDPVFIEKHDMAEYTDSSIYEGGILRPDIGGIHPAKLLHEMKRLALEAGVRLFSETAVLEIRQAQSDFLVLTSRGEVKAQHVISATNAYTDRAQPWLRRRLVPVISEMIATEKIGRNRVQSLMPKLTMFGESKQLGYYYRPSPDGERILLGGRRAHDDRDRARRHLQSALATIFPALDDVNVEAHWQGFVAFPFDQLPKLVVRDGIIYPTGFCGSGTVWARWLGQKAALMILGKDGESVFSNLPLRTMPFYTGDPWFMPLAMSYYKLRDRLSASTK
ncbi:MAG: FAD-binding oxidoreductase [Pseudomonadota bacterium]|nr:FAD-binding oxidoreductase [Pseudomonadota bacterium]